MSFPAYDSYRDSGVDWIGAVPDNWHVVPLKVCYEVAGGATPKSDVEAYWDGGIPWITPGDLGGLTTLEIGETARTISEEGLSSCATSLLPSGSVVLSTRAPIGSLGITARPSTTNQGCKSLVPRPGAHSRYLAYVLSSATEALNVRGKGTTFLELSGDELARFKVPAPRIDEQRAIAAFLDLETAKIDALVEAQRRLIELLKEKRQAVISHAVTKGLDPAVPMKDSGVQWLGEVPAHWEVAPIKAVTSCNDDVLTETTPADFEIEYIEISDVHAAQGIKGSTTYTFSDAPSRARRMLQDGDVLVSTVRTYLRAISQVRSPSENLIASTGFAVLRPRAVHPGFLGYAVQSEATISEVIARSVGVSYPAINASDLVRIPIPIPSLSDQTAIADILDRETDKIDALVRGAEAAMELLRERRAALISAAVTGKIDVRGLVPEQAEAA